MFQIGNERVALVTDTSCDLSDEQLSQYDIRTVALRVATSQGEFRDRLEITQEQLYDLLQREVPKTSLPLPEDVSNLYRTLHDEGATSILHLSISGSLSGTFNMVSLLAEDFEDMKIHVFDSKTLSCGLGLLVLEAAESLQNGMSVRIPSRCWKNAANISWARSSSARSNSCARAGASGALRAQSARCCKSSRLSM